MTRLPGTPPDGWWFWATDAALREFECVRVIDIRSPDPVPSPYRLWNIRAVVPRRDQIVVTGAEDGDLCLVGVSSG